MQDTIERSIDIAAPLERVWDLVTDPGWWVPNDATAAGQAAAPVCAAGQVVVRVSQQWGRFPVEVVELRPMTYAAFRWSSAFPGEDLKPAQTTLIEFTVTPIADGARVSVIESGFSKLDAPDEVKTSSIESNSGGWPQELASLRDRAQA